MPSFQSFQSPQTMIREDLVRIVLVGPQGQEKRDSWILLGRRSLDFERKSPE